MVYSHQYNFGASDLAISISQNNTHLVALPAIAGGLVIAYNLDSAKSVVKFSRAALPRIFDGTITQWNHPLLVADNSFLANISSTITIVRRSKTSGSTVNLIKALAMMDSTAGYTESPFSTAGYYFSMKNSVAAATTSAAGVIIGSIPWTLTYLNQYEASQQCISAGFNCVAGLVQHVDGTYLNCTIQTLKAAVTSVTSNSLDVLNVYNSTLLILDLSVSGAYPLAVISNWVIDPEFISLSYINTVWALRFMWYFFQHPEFSEQLGFVSLGNSAIASKTLTFLEGIKFAGQQLYGNSICDPLINGSYTNPCVHGYCPDILPFQSSSSQCLCDYGFQNINNVDCSEKSPFLSVGIVSKIQIALAVSGLVIVTAIIVKLYTIRNNKAIKSMSPPCCFFILAGCMIGLLAIIFSAANATKASCYLANILPALAFGMIFSMIFFKALRLGLIFGYQRIARLQFLRDDFLIGCSFILSIIDAILAWLFVGGSQYQPRLQVFSDQDTGVWICSSTQDATDTTISELFAILIAFNAVVLVLCLGIGFATRKVTGKFDESKKVGIVILISTVLVLLGLA
ncbi:hypothetical protein HK100_006008, partial [Physocladia obscura]